MTEFFLKIVNMSISASWIVLAVLLLRLLLKKAPKWINVILWGIVGLRLVMPFTLESVFSLIPSAETVTPEIMMDKTPQINTGVPIINNAINPVISESFTPAPMDSANPLQIWIPIFALVWVIGIVGMVLYTVISFLRVKRKIGTAVLLCDNIYQSESVVSPFVLGILRPKIYLPFNMNEQDMAQVIAHENAHISRKDHLWKPLGFLILTLHWFNPLMWLGYVLLCRDIELACDEKVVKTLNNEQKADYSQALLACSVNRRIIAACPLAFGEVGVKKRIKSVLNYKKPAFWLVLTAIVLSVVVAVCFLTNPASSNNKALLSVLNNEKSFINESGEEVYLKDYKVENSAYVAPEKYALLDLDGDKKDELVLYDNSDYGAYIVFHIFEDKVYAFNFGERHLMFLKEDGTFIQSGGAGLHKYATLSFKNNTYIINEEAYIDDTNNEYRINGVSSTQEKAKEYEHNFHENKRGVSWKKYDYSIGRGYELIYNRFLFGQETAFNEYDVAKHIEDYFLDENLKENYCYAYFDMTGDKLPELCIDTDIEMYFFTIKDGELYHWHTETNTYSKLLNNGAFLMERHGGAPDHINYEYYELDKNAKRSFSFSFSWWDKATADGIEFYEINGVEVSEREYNRKTKKYLKIGDDKIKWYSINENIEEAFDMVFNLSNSTYSNLRVLVTLSVENQTATALTVFDKDTNRKIQTIALNENELFTSRVLYAIDVNFDGEQDIVIPQSSSASASYLSAFLWDRDTMQYIYAPTFENLANVALDTKRELVLSSRSSDRTVSYAISDYDEGSKDFVVRKTLSYYPDETEENVIYKEKQLKNGRLQIVKEFIKPFTNYYTMDPEVANYYENHTEWQLNSSIWENYLVISQEITYESYKLSVNALKKIYPQFFGVSTDGGLTVYVWQTDAKTYKCHLANTSMEAISDNSFAYTVKDSATIEEMKVILSSYDIDKSEITIQPVINPLSSYYYEITDAYRAKIQAMFFGNDGASIPKLSVTCNGAITEAVKGSSSWTYDMGNGMMQSIEANAAHLLNRIDYLLPLALKVKRYDNTPLIAKLDFDIVPDNIKVNSWFLGENGKTKAFDSEVQGFDIKLNESKETCIYEIVATWNKNTKAYGTVTYSFAVVEAENLKYNSNIYTDDEIEQAIKVIKADFKKDWKGCTLKKIAYLGDERLKDYREFADRNNYTDVLVLTSDFYVAPTGADGSLNADSTYRDFKWILVRNKGEAWKHVDHGYP